MNKNRIRRLFVADYLLTPDQVVRNAAVLCENEKILAVGGYSGFSHENDIEEIRLDHAYITPGFIDTHIHGAGGFDCSGVKESPKDLAAMSALLGQRGVTGFFPTVVADAPDKMLTNLADLREAMRAELPGAAALGINIEGPFLNPKKSGSQAANVSGVIDPVLASELLDAGGGLVKVMTFAPELPGAEKLCELLISRGVIASMGHSVADEAETLRAIDAGASHCTHLFNGMEPLHQRDVGLAVVALTDSRVTVELIIDGRHVHSRMVRVACLCKPRRLIGISDCTMAAGMPDGNYRIGPAAIVVRGGRSQTEAGNLAGTTTLLDDGWHSLMGSGHLAETQAAQAVTANPASHYGLTGLGSVRPGYPADIAIFECGTNRPLLTLRRGKIIHRADK